MEMYSETECPVCGDTIHKTADSPLMRELRRHVFMRHAHELLQRLKNPHDRVIEELAEWEIHPNRKDLRPYL